MDTLTKYRNLVRRILTEYAEISNRDAGDVKTDVLFDDENDRYMLFRTGWWRKKRIHSATVYIRLIQDKIWIEEDWTEDGIATDLLEAGVPKSDIVLAFHPPELRPLTEFAVA
ncbi:MAG: XisI protein [Caldilineaceae bacterium]